MAKKLWVTCIKEYEPFSGGYDYPRDGDQHIKDIESHILQMITFGVYEGFCISDAMKLTAAHFLTRKLLEMFEKRGRKTTLIIGAEQENCSFDNYFITLSKTSPVRAQYIHAEILNVIRYEIDRDGRLEKTRSMA